MKNLLFLLVIALSIGNRLTAQNISYVTVTGAGFKDGSGWTDAFDEAGFQNALANASPGQVFYLAAGTYKPGNTRAISFAIPSGVQLYGGFPNTGNPTFAARDWSLHETTLSGEIGGIVATDNCYHVVYFAYADSTTLLDGFTVTGGYANGNGENSNGAGIYNIGTSSLTGSNPVITNCKILKNYADNLGGGMYNNATSSGKCVPIISKCIFERNTAYRGGALVATSNNAGNGSSTGECSPNVSRCIFIANRAAQYGAAAVNNATDGGVNRAKFTNCLFIHNVGNGATIWNDAYWPTGFGTASGNCLVNIVNCTFAKDTSTNNDASIIHSGTFNSAVCTTNVTNCILWNNTTPYINNYQSGVTNVTYSDVQGGYSGTGNIAANPLFLDPSNDDYRIASCSPCVNTGLAIGAPNNDLTGNTRPVKGAYDMGSYESLDTGIIAAALDLTVSPNDSFCAGSLIYIQASTNAPAPTYQWRVNGNNIGLNSPVYSADSLENGDIITCRVSSNASCINPSIAFDTVTAYVDPLAIADFTMSNNGLNYSFTNGSSNHAGHKWYFGDGDSSIVVNPTHAYAANGNYTVMLVAYNDCGSDTFTQSVNLATSIDESMFTDNIQIYPNPNNGSFVVVSNETTEPIQFIVTNLLGEVVFEQSLQTSRNSIALSQPSGIYSVTIIAENKRLYKRLIIQ